MDKLPIELIQGSRPPRFRWKRIVDTPDGKRPIECEGCVTASMEDALISLILKAETLDKRLSGSDGALQVLARLTAENEKLKSQTPPSTPVVQPIKQKAR